jgi:hypothetical protein
LENRSTSDTEQRRQRLAEGSVIAAGSSTNLLNIGAEHTVVVTSSEMLKLAIGFRKTAADHFRHVPPSPTDMENASAAVEDEVMRLRSIAADDSQLSTADSMIRQFAILAGVTDAAEMSLSREAVEQTFGRPVAMIHRRPAAAEGLPSDSGFSAVLLILREVLHHLKFATIRIINPSGNT